MGWVRAEAGRPRRAVAAPAAAASKWVRASVRKTPRRQTDPPERSTWLQDAFTLPDRWRPQTPAGRAHGSIDWGDDAGALPAPDLG
jgi:hypothetical protein